MAVDLLPAGRVENRSFYPQTAQERNEALLEQSRRLAMRSDQTHSRRGCVLSPYIPACRRSSRSTSRGRDNPYDFDYHPPAMVDPYQYSPMVGDPHGYASSRCPNSSPRAGSMQRPVGYGHDSAGTTGRWELDCPCPETSIRADPRAYPREYWHNGGQNDSGNRVRQVRFGEPVREHHRRGDTPESE
jgi:hypothetical protein